MVKLNILKQLSYGLVGESDFEDKRSAFYVLHVTGSKIEIYECTLLGSSRTHIHAHNKS